MKKAYWNLFFRDLFFQRNYLFIADLLTVSRFQHTLTIALTLTLTLAITLILTLVPTLTLTLKIVWDLSQCV